MALLLFTFNAFEKQKTHLAALFIVLTVFIKIFGAVAFILFLLYPNKLKFILWSALWALLLLVLPLVVVSPEQLIFQYQSWWNMLQNDHSVSVGFSVIGWLKTWFNIEANKLSVVLIGATLLMLPLLKTKLYNNELFRKLMLASVMIWVIIFNHKAESATFIIAVTGIAVWWFSIERNKFLLALVVLAFVFTCLSPTDLFPRSWRNDFVTPYVLKAVPCILIWCVMQFQLLTTKLKV